MREIERRDIANKLPSRGTDYDQVIQRWAKRGHAYRVTRERLNRHFISEPDGSCTAEKKKHIHTEIFSFSLSSFPKINLFAARQCLKTW